MREKENTQEKNPQVINGMLVWIELAVLVQIKYKAQLEVLCSFGAKFNWSGDLQIRESKHKNEESKCKWVQLQ